MNRQQMSIQDQKNKWLCLGKQLNHIIMEDELVRLLTVELPDFQFVEEAESEGMEVDLWWAQVAEATLGGEKKFPILSRLALALCTICNSSSEVERDFSDMEAISADPRANATGQKLLDAKMTVKSAVKQESKRCARCKASKEDRKRRAAAGEGLPRDQCAHCHCSFLEVDKELLTDLRNCGPRKRWEESDKKAAAKQKEKEKASDEDKKKRKEDYERMLKKETVLMKKRYQEEKREEAEKEKRKDAESKEKRKSAEKGEKKKRKIVAIVKEADDKKKKRLAFLTDTEGNVRSKEQEKETEKPRKNAQEKVVNRTKKVVNCGK